ncbi:MAG: cytochrome c oxidase assembly protein, partial [Mesorhizobium sp.]
WYPENAGGAALWGLSPIEDQQLAGLVMWVPAGLIYGGAALLLAGLWISKSGTREATHALRSG